MQSHERVWDFTQNFRSEVNPGGGRGNRAGRLGKNGLVAGRVLLIAWPGDIRRQRGGAAGINIDIFV
jgi:hypothetical protein